MFSVNYARTKKERAAMAVQSVQGADRVQRDHFPSDVYFIRAIGLQAVKIGYAADAAARLRHIATACPVEVELIGSISTWAAPAVEADWHQRFRQDRLRGEWFRETPALLEAIDAAIRAAPDAAEEAVLAGLRKVYG